MADLLKNMAEEFVPNKPYTKGKRVLHNKLLYEFTEGYSGEWDESKVEPKYLVDLFGGGNSNQDVALIGTTDGSQAKIFSYSPNAKFIVTISTEDGTYAKNFSQLVNISSNTFCYAVYDYNQRWLNGNENASAILDKNNHTITMPVVGLNAGLPKNVYQIT